MKTAMQELIELIEKGETRLDLIENHKQIWLEKEKEQICNAYTDGAKGGANGTKGQHEFGYVSIQIKEKYYNQTYNN